MQQGTNCGTLQFPMEVEVSSPSFRYLDGVVKRCFLGIFRLRIPLRECLLLSDWSFRAKQYQSSLTEQMKLTVVCFTTNIGARAVAQESASVDFNTQLIATVGLDEHGRENAALVEK